MGMFANSWWALRCLSLTACVSLLISCNKEFPNKLLEYSEQQGYDAGTAKVLFVMVDGLRGTAIQEIQPDNLMALSESSMFAYSSLADHQTAGQHSKEIGWANLLSGTTSAKHGVIDADLDRYKSDQYPHLFDRLDALDEEYETAGYSSSSAFSDVFLSGAVQGGLVEDDQAVFDGVNSALAETDGSVFLAHFTDVDQAGQLHSYASDDPDYRAAIQTLDKRVAGLIETIGTRDNVETENWLIVINGSSGGQVTGDEEVDNTVYGDHLRNVFTMYYSPKFNRKFYPKPNSQSIPYVGSAVRYTYGDRATNAVLDDADMYNFGADRDFTISFNFKSNIEDGNWNYPIFLSKRDQGFSGAGWNIFGEIRGGSMALGFNSNIGGQVFSGAVNDGNWHNVTVTVTRGDSLRMFTNGVFSEAQSVNGNSVDNSAPLVIGKKIGNDNSAPDVLMANLQIYDRAFTREDVAQHAGKTLIERSHPYYENLIGYWPSYDDIGTARIRDLSGNNNHMALRGDYNWVSFTDIVSYFTPPVSDAFYRIVPNGVDAPFMIYQWLGVIPQEDWELEGKSWTPDYKAIN